MNWIAKVRSKALVKNTGWMFAGQGLKDGDSSRILYPRSASSELYGPSPSVSAALPQCRFMPSALIFLRFRTGSGTVEGSE